MCYMFLSELSEPMTVVAEVEVCGACAVGVAVLFYCDMWLFLGTCVLQAVATRRNIVAVSTRCGWTDCGKRASPLVQLCRW